MKKLILKYSFESVLIVGGIILSFYIQGRIERRENVKEAKTILKQIYNDMKKDTITYGRQISNAGYIIDVCDYLLEYDYEAYNDEDTDTLVFLMGESTYNLTTPMHEAGYTRWTYFGKKKVVKDEALINDIVSYYTINKTVISGYQNTDIKFVDGKLTEAYLKPENHGIMDAYYRLTYKNEPVQPETKKAVISFLSNKEVRSLLMYNISIKDAYRTVIMDTKEHASKRMASIDAWMNK